MLVYTFNPESDRIELKSLVGVLYTEQDYTVPDGARIVAAWTMNRPNVTDEYLLEVPIDTPAEQVRELIDRARWQTSIPF